MARGCRVITIKEGYHLGENIEAKVLAFAFGISAEIERQLISQRTTYRRHPQSRNRTPLPRLKKDAVQLVKTGINNRKLWKNQKVDDYFIVFDYICLGINGPCCYEKKDNSTSY